MAIQKQLVFFKENRQELCSKYNNPIIGISCDLQVSVFTTMIEAYEYGESQYGLGNFLLKRCVAFEDEVHIITPHIKAIW